LTFVTPRSSLAAAENVCVAAIFGVRPMPTS
jgi:negative regulator of sigma E activity